MQRQDIYVHISSSTLVKVAFFGLLIATLYYLHNLVLVILTAVVIASAVEPSTRFLMRYRIPRVPAVMAIYAAFVFFFFGLVYFFLPPVLTETIQFLNIIPQYIAGLEEDATVGSLINAPSLINQLSIHEVVAEIQTALASFSNGILQTAAMIFGGLLSFVLIFVLSFYLAAQERGIEDFLRIVVPPKNREYAVGLWQRSQEKIGKWMQGQLLLALIVGVLVYLGLAILQVPYALVLAVIAAICELIPIFGPLISAIPALGIAVVEGGAGLALWTAGLYGIVQQFENHLIYPLVVKKVVGVPAILVIISLIAGAQLAGFLGILLSVPIAATIQELVADLQRGRTMRESEVVAK